MAERLSLRALRLRGAIDPVDIDRRRHHHRDDREADQHQHQLRRSSGRIEERLPVLEASLPVRVWRRARRAVGVARALKRERLRRAQLRLVLHAVGRQQVNQGRAGQRPPEQERSEKCELAAIVADQGKAVRSPATFGWN